MTTRRGLALGLAGMGLTGLAATGAQAKSARVGQPAPDFEVTTFGHEKIAFADLHGQVIILNYWATWCAPCRAEMLVMDTYLRRRRVKDLKIFAVTIDNTAPEAKLRPLAEALAFPLITKLKGSGYGAIGGAVPTSYVIDRAGVIRHAKAGAFTDASFDALITPLLAEAPPPPLATSAAT